MLLRFLLAAALSGAAFTGHLLAQTSPIQDPLATLDVVRCATGGAHLPGCYLYDPTCSVSQMLAGTCPNVLGAVLYGIQQPPGEPLPPPVPPPPPPPPPPPATDGAPTALVDLGATIGFAHSGDGVSWFTLRIDTAYANHVSSNIRAIELPILVAGTYAVTVEACGDDTGCVVSAPLTIQR